MFTSDSEKILWNLREKEDSKYLKINIKTKISIIKITKYIIVTYYYVTPPYRI
jgi:hypothetical protein